ncbi:MAG: ABC transporter permease [Lachnospiraceae bacterium]|nr:ABC transporter permease [Lachnospiraceae bacterium]
MQNIISYFSTDLGQYIQYVIEHLEVSLLSILFAIVIAVPLGIISTKYQWIEKVSLWFWGTLRIIPSLAILVFCIPIMGTGMKPAILALTVLAIPPILMNTTLAFQTLPEMVIEAATGMGMSPQRLFFTIKVPLAFPVIFTGIRTAIVEVIASATLATYIGAGGLGTLIFTGLGLMRNDLLWIGGISVAILSLGTGFLLSAVDKWLTRYQRVNG